MTRYFTHYWTEDSLTTSRDAGYSNIAYAASNQFRKRGLSRGDVIYPITFSQGQMLVVGRFEVSVICGRSEAERHLRTSDLFDASDYAVAEAPTPVNYKGFVVPTHLVKDLYFIRGDERSQPVFVSDSQLDQQTLRGVRELDPSSAILLDRVINDRAQSVTPTASSTPYPARLALRRYEEYTREEVHDIFDPNSAFRPQVGTWGIRGIVSVPDCPGDFVFFVTYGREQGDHVFDEGITTEGVISWQSQPNQVLASRQVQRFITHDHLTNNIYLMLRTKRDLPYTYLGKLQYLTHDRDRERPVYFQWQILDWEERSDVFNKMNLRLVDMQSGTSEPSTDVDRLKRQSPPDPKPTMSGGKGKTTNVFQGTKSPDYSAIDAKNRALGLAGEKLVVKTERDKLTEAGCPELASKVRHVSVEIGDGTGYDVLSFSVEGEEKFIEVKTTSQSASTPFFMSANEVAFSEANPESYCIYRVYAYRKETNSGEYFVVEGDVTDSFNLTPTNYRLTTKAR